MEYITVKDEDGQLRPQAALWPVNHMLKYYEPDITKYMKKASKEGMTLVKISVVEVGPVSLDDIPKY